MVLIPLRTTETSPWFHTHWSAQSAGVRLRGAVSQTSWIAGGTFLVRSPPRSGSMITTARPLPAAYFSPSVPAWWSMSMKLY